MSYENSPSAKLLASHCAACGRPLVDAESCELGIGPVCRRRYFQVGGFTDEAVSRANKIVNTVARSQSETAILAAVVELQELDFTILADIIYKRSQEWKGLERVLDAREQTVKYAVASNTRSAEDDATNKEPVVCIRQEGTVFSVVTPRRDEALESWRNIPGRLWDKARRLNIIPQSSRPQLWALLMTFYPGEQAMGPKGAFTIPGSRPPF